MSLVKQAEFAKLTGAARSTVAGWLKDGMIGGKAVVREGGRVLIDVDLAKQQLQNRRDLSQAHANGLHIKVSPSGPPKPRPAAPALPVPPAEAVAPDGERLFDTPADPFGRGFVTGALLVAYEIPALAVFHAVEAGAPLPVAYAMAKALTAAAREQAAIACAHILPGEMFPMRYPEAWSADDVAPVSWEAIAAREGVPPDLTAWEAWLAERDALNYPPDAD